MEIGRREWIRAVFVFVEEQKRFNTEDTEEDHRGHGDFGEQLHREVAEAAAPEG
jgi:hypothetical protein